LVRDRGVADPAPKDATWQEKSRLRHIAAREYFASLPDRDAVIADLRKLNLAWGDVREASTIREQPTVKHRGTIIEVDNRAGGTRPVVQSPYRFTAATAGVRGPAPWRGE